MIGVVVVTHANLGRELINAATMILGPPQKVDALSIDRGTSVDEAKQQLDHLLVRLGNDGDGVIILTDLFGGTPTNISAEFLYPDKVEILTGVNLPMLIKCISARQAQTLDDLAAMLKDYGRNAVMRPVELFS